MYYYIVDPPQTKSDQQIMAALRNKLVPEGIAGEFIYRTPGQSAAGLAQKAMQQGFSTIVAVGDDLLASELATALWDQPAALGVIPVRASASLHSLIGYSNWQNGIQALKNRKLALRDLGTINSEIGFLSDLVLKGVKATEFYLHMSRFAATLKSTEIMVRLPLDTEPFAIPGVINFVVMRSSSVGGIFSTLFRSREESIETLLRSEQAVIQSRDAASIYYGGLELAHTPMTISIIPQAIRMVVARTIKSNENGVFN